MYGLALEDRRATIDETMRVLRAAWSGRPFDYHGRTVEVTPAPSEPPPLLTGGSFRSVARAAARVADGFRGSGHALYEEFRAERVRLGHADPGPYPRFGPDFLYVSDDPDAAWEVLAPHVMHSGNAYTRWAHEASQDPNERFPAALSIEDLKARPEAYRVVTPAECIALSEDLGPDGILRHQPLVGGLDPEFAWKGIELFEREVLPHIDVVHADELRY
jgi:alkanesulfonate monooxygenase SsuD/methylene tetrahydromethanopterin reductase-like flavin-dependent oxidoreductase (luciferase family)